MFDMNSGYSGWSMSNRAVDAYEAGYKPKSKWTKASMLDEISSYCDNSYLVPTVDFAKLKKAELFDRFFEYKAWHHTSKFCNETTFYGVDEDALAECAREMTDDEIAEQERVEEERRAAAQSAREELQRFENERSKKLFEQKKLDDRYTEEHGFAPDTLFALAECYPDKVSTRVSKRGNVVYFYDNGAKHHEGLGSEHVWFFNATVDDGAFFD